MFSLQGDSPGGGEAGDGAAGCALCGEAEVGQPGDWRGDRRHQDVVRLDVAVHDALPLQPVCRHHDLGGHVNGGLSRLPARQRASQSLPRWPGVPGETLGPAARDCTGNPLPQRIPPPSITQDAKPLCKRLVLLL